LEGGDNVIKLQVSLDSYEAEALARLAAAELRDPREQIRFILREELRRRNLLPAEIREMSQETGHAAKS
jgi:hypothetical protein